MAYAAVEQLREWLGKSGDEEDALLERLIDGATAYIEAALETSFAAAERVLTLDEADGQYVWLPLSVRVVRIVSIAEGDPQTPVSSDEWEAYPAYAVWPEAVKRDSGWQTPVVLTVMEGATEGPPADIVEATIQIAAHWYRQRQGDGAEVVAYPGDGVIIRRRGIPVSAAAILDAWRERLAR